MSPKKQPPVPTDHDYVRISERTDGKWQWAYHTAGNHEPSGGDQTQGFDTKADAVTAAVRVTGYSPPNLDALDTKSDAELVWPVVRRTSGLAALTDRPTNAPDGSELETKATE